METVNTKRNVNIELMRIVGCFMVIMLHTLSFNKGLLFYSRVFAQTFVLNGVPLFWMITGYFMFTSNKKYSLRIKNTLLYILLPTIILIFITQLFAPWLRCQQSVWYCLEHPDIDWGLTLRNVFGWTSETLPLCGHLWYVFAYMRLIIWFPLLHLICKNAEKENKIRRGYILIAFLCVILKNIQYISQYIMDTSVEITFFSPFDINIFYVLLGYEMSIFMKKKGERDTVQNNSAGKKTKRKAFIIVLAMDLILFGICVICREIGLSTSDYLSIKTVMVVISSVCIFYIVMNIKINEGLERIIFYIADKTFYVYLFHYIIIRKLTAASWFWEVTEKIKGLGTFILISLLAFVIAFIMAVIIKILQKLVYQCLAKKKQENSSP